MRKKRNNFRAYPFVCYSRRCFSRTPILRTDPVTLPLTATSLAFNVPYSPSVLANPLGVTFIILVGLATSLFFLSEPMYNFFLADPPTPFTYEQAYSIFCAYDTFLSREKIAISEMWNDLSNYSPELLRGFYFQIQELITVRELNFITLFGFFDHPRVSRWFPINPVQDFLPNAPIMSNAILLPYTEREYLERHIARSMFSTIAYYRRGGNDLFRLLRHMEDVLQVPFSQRIPVYMFEYIPIFE
jgi:hypothetical protein